MSQPKIIEGHLSAKGRTFAIVASRFNHFIVDHLVAGAIDTLVRHGASADDITVYKVPGAWELPLAAARIAKLGGVDGLVALGAVIRGSTPHFDYISAETTKGLASVSLKSDLPISFGVLTTDTIEQAIERAGTKAGNKGGEAALSLIETVDLFAKMGV
jgi:6,7-dimethyl-8-ribityllumazine synthase